MTGCTEALTAQLSVSRDSGEHSRPEPILPGAVETAMSCISRSSYQNTTALNLPSLHTPCISSVLLPYVATRTILKASNACYRQQHHCKRVTHGLLDMPNVCLAGMVNHASCITNRVRCTHHASPCEGEIQGLAVALLRRAQHIKVPDLHCLSQRYKGVFSNRNTCISVTLLSCHSHCRGDAARYSLCQGVEHDLSHCRPQQLKLKLTWLSVTTAAPEAALH